MDLSLLKGMPASAQYRFLVRLISLSDELFFLHCSLSYYTSSSVDESFADVFHCLDLLIRDISSTLHVDVDEFLNSDIDHIDRNAE